MAERPIRHLLRDMYVVLRLGPTGWFDLLHATMELALARYRLGNRTAKQLLQETHKTGQLITPPSPATDAIAARAAFAIPRMAVRLPWRTDCWVQAMAAQRWLHSKGIASQLTIGTRKNPQGMFQAHAWLNYNDVIITGGDISGYVPLVTPEIPLPPDGRS